MLVRMPPIRVSLRALRIFAIAFPFMGLHASLGGALRGAGDVRYVLGVITVTAWLVRIPVAVILTIVFGLGAPGAWVGATTENPSFELNGALFGLFSPGRDKALNARMRVDVDEFNEDNIVELGP